MYKRINGTEVISEDCWNKLNADAKNGFEKTEEGTVSHNVTLLSEEETTEQNEGYSLTELPIAEVATTKVVTENQQEEAQA